MGFTKYSEGKVARVLEDEDRQSAERRAADYYALHGPADESFCGVCGRALVVDENGLPHCPDCSVPDPEAG